MSEFTKEKLAKLRAVAEAATQGEWRATEPQEWGDDEKLQSAVMVSEGETLTWDDHGGEVFHPADATFIATFDPPTVTALIAALEAKTAEVEAAERQLAIRAEDSIARRLAMATVAEVGTETAAGDTADTLAELLIEAERERDEARELYKGACEAEDALNSVNDALINRAEKAEAALERVRALHHDAGESQGYMPDVRGGYGMIPHCCASCGSFGEYGMAWPCQTIQAIQGADDV